MTYVFVFFFLAMGLIGEKIFSGKTKNIFYCAESLILILLMGLRYHVGGDSIRYETYFSYTPSIKELFSTEIWTHGFQPGWIIISAIVKDLTNSYFVLQFIVCAFVNSTFFILAKKRCSSPLTFIFLYFIFQYFYFSAEILRESIAITLFMIGFNYIFQRKFFQYFLFCFLAYCFHASALFTFFLPFFYFLISKTSGYKSFIVVGFITALFVIFSETIYSSVSDTMFSNNVITQGKIENIQNSGKLNIFGVIVALFYTVPAFIIFHIKAKQESAFPKNERLIILMYLTTCIIGILAQPLTRLQNYFAILFLFVLADAIHKNSSTLSIKFLLSIALSIMVFSKLNYYTSNSQNSNTYALKRYQKYIPYSSILAPTEDTDRYNATIKEFD